MGVYGQGRMMVLGVDPGRGKMGWSLVGQDGEFFLSGICPVSEVEFFLTALTYGAACWEHELSPWVIEKARTDIIRPDELSFVAVGDGTGSRETVKLFERLGIQIAVVDERGTTLEARGLYWSIHAPSWWQRCLPRTMRVPPRPLDDLSAWAIARRSLEII